MTFDKCLELAATAWCKPETCNTVVDINLAKEFAKILYRNTAFESLKELVQKDHEIARGWHANIAVCAKDEGMEYEAAQRTASRFMKLAFDVTI